MKYPLVLVSGCLLLLLTGCSQSPERLLATGNKYHNNKKYKEASILYRKAIAKDKTFAEAYYREGLNMLDQRSPAEAAKFLRRAVDLKSSNVDAEIKLAEIYFAAYSSDPKRLKALLTDVRDLTAKILKNEPHSFDGIRLQAMGYLADKNIDKALESFAEANRLKPHAREVVGWYGETLLANGHPDDAEKLVRETLAQDKTWGPGYDFLYLLYAKKNDTAAAEAVLHERVQNDPSSAMAVTNLAGFQLNANRYSDAEATMKRVLDDKKDFPANHEMMGDFYFRAKKYDQALEQYQAGAKEDEKNALHYQQRMVGVYTIQGRRGEATVLARTLAEKNPKDGLTTQLYASILLESGLKTDANKSLEELRKLVQNNGTDAVLHLDLSRAYFGLGDPDKALGEAQEASRIQPNLSPARLVIARILEDKKQHAKALEQTEVLLNTDPKNPDARLIRARALIGVKEVDQAQRALEALVKEIPAMNDARLLLANLYVGQKEYAKASEQFSAVYQTNPPDMRGFLGLENVKLQQGKSDEAIQSIAGLVQKNPNDLNYRFVLANFQATAGTSASSSNPERAKVLCQQAADNYKEILKTTANSADVWLRLGLMQRQLGQYEPALASFEQAGNANNSNAEAFLNRAMLLEAMGRIKEAREQYNKVLGVESENTVALNNLAFLAADTGDNLDQAMTLAERAKKRLPNNPDISDTLGYVYFKKNLNAEALRIFKQVVENEPKNPTFHFHLAMALLKKGDKQGAKDEAAKALQNSSKADEQTKIRFFVSQIG